MLRVSAFAERNAHAKTTLSGVIRPKQRETRVAGDQIPWKMPSHRLMGCETVRVDQPR